MLDRFQYSNERRVQQSLAEYGRGLAGGLLFSLPLLYTMEVWWVGQSISPAALIAVLSITFLLLLGYNRYAGLHDDASWTEVAIDSVEELGLGLLVSATILWLTGRLRWEMAGSEIVGKIVLESITVAIGVSVGTAQLGGDQQQRRKKKNDPAKPHEPQLIRQGVLGICGAVLIAGNVAPTEEILVIASEIDPIRLLGIAILSLTMCALIMYFSEFVGSGTHFYSRTDAILGVSFTYVIALLTSAALLFLFGELTDLSNHVRLAQVIVLGLPATLGASAGRLLLQQ